jgi:hypothetical protein
LLGRELTEQERDEYTRYKAIYGLKEKQRIREKKSAAASP